MSSIPPSPNPLRGPGRLTWARQALSRLESTASSTAFTWSIFSLLVLLYFLLTALASARQLWHDELYTYYIATAPSWPRFWEEMHLDLNPPLEYLAVRASTVLFGHGSYAVRLPSIIAFLGGSLCLWRFVAKRLGATFGLIALLVLWASPFFYYATEARPYALIAGFLGATLLASNHATEPDRTTSSLLLLALAVAGMTLSHMMAVLYVTPFCLSEILRTYQSRRLDGALWLALLLPCAIPFVYIRLMARFQSSLFPSIFQASFRKIFESYYGSLRLEALPLLVAFLLGISVAYLLAGSAICGARPPSRFEKSVGPTDFALTLGLLASPAVVNIVLMRSHGAYFDRYALPVAFGYALLIAYVLALQTNFSQFAATVASSVLFTFVIAYNLGPGLKQSAWARSGATQHEFFGRSLTNERPQLPLVAASGLTFLEMDRYENARTVDRLYYLTDPSMAVQYAHATIFESMATVKQYFPIRAHVEPYSSFVLQHSTFLVLGTPDYPEDWLLRALLDHHATVQYLGNFHGPYKDSELYQVTVTGA